MVQRYDIDDSKGYPIAQIVPDDLGDYVHENDYIALERRCKEAEEHAGTRWKELDAERQSHTITKRELEGVRQRCKELETVANETTMWINAVAELRAENAELRKRLEKEGA